MQRNKIHFWTAAKIWWRKDRGMVETITLGALAVIGIQAVFCATIEFLTLKWLGHIWRKITGKKSEE